MELQEIFEKSVTVMNRLLSREEISRSIKRAKERGDEGNIKLLEKQREAINELVREIAVKPGAKEMLGNTPQELIDGVILRYFRNRDMFLKTFPEGIEGIDPEPVSIWAAIMISPMDEAV